MKTLSKRLLMMKSCLPFLYIIGHYSMYIAQEEMLTFALLHDPDAPINVC